MKKHLTRTISLLLLALLCCLGAVSCNKDDPVTPQPPEETGIPFFENGAFLYRIVRSDNADTKSVVTTESIRVRKALKAVTGVEPELATDWEDKDDNASIPEILLGKTNREASKSVGDLGPNDYVIKTVGNKIVILGGNDSTLKKAIDRFLLDYIGYISEEKYEEKTMLRIPENLDIRETWEYSGKALLVKSSDKVNFDDALAEALKTRGIELTRTDYSMPAKEMFSLSTADLVILEDARVFPFDAMDALNAYLKAGGRLLTLGGPAFTEMVYNYGGEWMSRSDYMREYIADLPASDILYFFDTADEADVKKLGRSTNTPANKVEKTVDDFGLEGHDAELCVEVSNLDSWELIVTSFQNSKKGLNALGFYAMGDSNSATDSLYVEITEKDGTRWYAIVNVSDDWQYCWVTPADFKWWAGDASKKSSRPIFDDVKSCSIGFALSGRSVPLGHHVYYLADPCFLKLDADFPLAEMPKIDCLSPEYEMYPVTNAAKLTVYGEENQTFLAPKELTVPSEIISCSPGRQGKGYNDGRISRFIPLIEITDEKGLHSGYAAWINVFSGTTDQNAGHEGAVIGSFGAVSDDFYNAAGLSAVADTAKALLNPVFLVEGGMTEHTYIASDTKMVTFGGSCIDVTKGGIASTVTVTLYDESGKELAKTSASGKDLKALNNRIQTVSSTYDVSGGRPAKAVTELTVDGKVIDKIVHNVKFWEPKPENERKYIYTEDGYFKIDGKVVNFFGVNYMPSSGIAEQYGSNFEYYVSNSAYDPEVIHNDLLHVKDIGFNAVSIFTYVQSVRESNNMLDLIEQCRELGIYCDVSIRPDAYPMKGFVEHDVEDLITKLHFPENDNIIAYDIAWEPQLGQNKEGSVRAGWDADWREWLKQQFGSIEHAEKLFGTKLPRDNAGNVIQVTDAMLESESSNRAMVASYRRFVDDQVAKIFEPKMAFMRSLDPNHLFSFRMANAGSALVGPSYYAYDFQSLASEIDFMSPEGYAVNSTAESALQIFFNCTYARYTNPDKPVVWKEYGRHVWNGSNFGNHSVSLKSQEDFYRYFLDYAYKSYSSAMYCWFFAGGYRINENSDYGVLNPDGSDRPSTLLLREYAPKFIGQGERKAAEVIIEVERDDFPTSIAGIFAKYNTQFVNAFKKGQLVALVNKQQDGENQHFYASTVLDQAVGGMKAEGQYPFRYINGQIKSVTTSADGKKVTVTFTNTGHADWDKDLVSIVSADGKTVYATIGEEIPYLGSGSVTFDVTSKPGSLRLAIGGVMFGYAF